MLKYIMAIVFLVSLPSQTLSAGNPVCRKIPTPKITITKKDISDFRELESKFTKIQDRFDKVDSKLDRIQSQLDRIEDLVSKTDVVTSTTSQPIVQAAPEVIYNQPVQTWGSGTVSHGSNGTSMFGQPITSQFYGSHGSFVPEYSQTYSQPMEVVEYVEVQQPTVIFESQPTFQPAQPVRREKNNRLFNSKSLFNAGLRSKAIRQRNGATRDCSNGQCPIR